MSRVRLGTFFAAQGWYPADPEMCSAEIRRMEQGLSDSEKRPAEGWIGGVVPHAGWMFSGRLAFHVFREIARAAPEPVERIVLFGGHLGPGSRGWILTHGTWPTPLGDVPVDAEFAGRLAQESPRGFLAVGPDGYEPDNTIELQMPFIRHCFPEAKVVALGVPARREGWKIGELAEKLAEELGGRTAFVGSTDLTHYGPNYGFAPAGYGPDAVAWVREENDRLSVDRIASLDPEGLVATALERHNACCPGAAASALAAGRQAGRERAMVLEYATSADVHPGPSFVGYVAAVF